MKKILLTLAFILVPSVAFAAIAAGWNATSTNPGYISPTYINGNQPWVQASSFFATSTTANNVFMGNVGIGTTGPVEKLDVNGNGRFAWLGKLSFEYDNIGSYSHGIQTGALGRGLNIFSKDNDSNGGILFTTGTTASPTDRMVILNNGNVGIGTLTPAAPLTVGSTAVNNTQAILLNTYYVGNSTVRAPIQWTDGSGITGQIDSRFDGTYTNMYLGHLYNLGYQTSDILSLMGNGNVGVNTVSPNYTLEVNGTASTSQLYGSNLSTCNSASNALTWNAGLFGCNTITGGSGGGSQWATSTDSTSIYPNVVKMVGIATSTATTTLDVNGSVNLEEKALATTTSMSLNFCTTNYNISMGVGSSNISFSWYGAAACPGTSHVLSINSPASGLIGSTTISTSDTGVNFIWDRGYNPGNSVLFNDTDVFCLTSKMATTSTGLPYIVASLCE